MSDTHTATCPHQLVQRWLDYLRFERSLSPHSLAAYQRDMQKLLEDGSRTAIHQFTPTVVRQCLSQLHAKGLKPRSLQRIVAAWRSFFNWYQDNINADFANPCAQLRTPKTPRPLPSALSVDDTQQLFTHSSAHATPEHLRDTAMFELLYSSGLRLGELVSLDTHYVQTPAYVSSSWLDLSEAQVWVQGKGNKRRSLPVGSKAMTALNAWLAERATWLNTTATQAPEQHYALFLGKRGQRIHPRIVQQQLKRFAQQAGLAQSVHPHALRHSFASHMLQSAQDLRAVQELLGHSSIRTTQIYTRLDFQHLAQVYDQAHPRAKHRTDKPDPTEE